MDAFRITSAFLPITRYIPLHEIARHSDTGRLRAIGMASASTEIDKNTGDTDNDDEDRTIDPALLEPPPGHTTHRCVIDRRGALAHWASQRGRVCAAAVVAGALNTILARDYEALTVEDVLLEYQRAWRCQFGAVAAGIEGFELHEAALLLDSTPCWELPSSDDPVISEKLALLDRLVASYRKLSAPDRARASTACVGVTQLMSALVNLGQARGLVHVDVKIALDREWLQTAGADDAWSRLWEALAPGKGEGDKVEGLSVVLVLHLPRHYSLVFGLRERRADPNLKLVREVLTSTKNQKPKEWVDFDECIVPLMQGPEGSKCQFVLVQRVASDVN